MVKIGLLSDTHGWLDPSIFRHFESCDEVWHAGDIGSVEIIHQLKAFKPSRIVFGNIDGTDIRQQSEEHLRWKCENVDVWITHIGGRVGHYSPVVQTQMKSNPPALFICGHSHICSVKMDTAYNCLYMNPGAAGRHGFHLIRTALRFCIEGQRIFGLEVIELGSRSEKFTGR